MECPEKFQKNVKRWNFATTDAVCKPVGNLNKIKTVTLDLTHQCPFRCPGCIENHSMTQTKGAAFSEFGALKIINELENMGVENLFFYGGEPTCHPQFSSLIFYAATKSFGISVITNGYNLFNSRINDSIRRAAEITAVRVRVSLNSGDQKTHAKLHGLEGCYERIIDGMGALTSDGSLVNLGISFLVEETNCGELYNALKVAESVNARALYLRPKTKLNGKDLIPLKPQDRSKVVSFINNARKSDHSVDIDVADWYLDYLENGKMPDTEKTYPKCFFCGGNSKLVITPPDPGKVWACTYFRHDDRFLICDLKDTQLGSEEFEKKRLSLNESICPSLHCNGVICNKHEHNLALAKRETEIGLVKAE